jgi:hypothetical protein
MMLGAYSFAWHGCGEGETRREIILPYREVVCALIFGGFGCCTEYNLAFLFFQIGNGSSTQCIDCYKLEIWKSGNSKLETETEHIKVERIQR